MSESFLDGRIVLHAGDSRDVIKQFPDNHFDSLVCDPPYALVSIVKRFGGANAAPAKGNEAYQRASAGFMGKQWDTGETAFASEFWAECLRVLKPGGHVVAFSGTRTYHRMACAIEDAGFEIRDQLQWLYGSGFPKSHDVSKGIDRAAGAVRGVVGISNRCLGPSQSGANGIGTFKETNWQDSNKVTAPATDSAIEWQGWGTALKPACEPICFGRKPLSEGTVAANVLEHGTGAINIDECRVETEDDQRRPSSGGDNGLAGTSTFKIRARSIDEQKVQGRWPANIIHDGSGEVIAAFPAETVKSGGDPNGGAFGRNGIYGAAAGAATLSYQDTGSAARFFYTAKADADDRLGSKHPTVKPVDLMQWLCRLVTPKGGTVLDPFAGTGTTGEAAFREGFKAVLIEREEEYQADIRRRMALCMAGPDERKRESIKAKVGDLPFEPGSLFA